MLNDYFFARGREFLGSRYPILCGAMTWISDATMDREVHNAGRAGLVAGRI